MASGDDKAASQAEHMAAPTTTCICSPSPCQRRAVHTGAQSGRRAQVDADDPATSDSDIALDALDDCIWAQADLSHKGWVRWSRLWFWAIVEWARAWRTKIVSNGL